MDLTITEETELKGRALRKWRAEKKVDKIFKELLSQLDKQLETESLIKSHLFVIRYVNFLMSKDPQNNVLYIRAIAKFDNCLESASKALDKLNINNKAKVDRNIINTEEKADGVK